MRKEAGAIVLLAVLLVLASRTIAVDVTECTTLNESGSYVLTQNINSTATCITLLNNSITLDCNSFNINYSQGSTSAGIGNGILASGVNNITVRNCSITKGGTGGQERQALNFSIVKDVRVEFDTITMRDSAETMAAFVTARNVTVANSTFFLTSSGAISDVLAFTSSSTNVVLRNNSVTLLGSSGVSSGIDADSCSNFIIDNNRIWVVAGPSRGIEFQTSVTNSTITNNTIYANGSIGAIGQNLLATSTTTSADNVIYTQTVGQSAVYATTGLRLGLGAYNNTIRNNSVYTNETSTTAVFGGVFLTNGISGNLVVDNRVTAFTLVSNGSAMACVLNCGNNTFANNTVFANGSTNSGFFMNMSTRNVIDGNTIRSTFTGILVKNTMTNNSFTRNTVNVTGGLVGVNITENAYGNLFNNTNIIGGRIGVMAGPDSNSTFYNTIINNPASWVFITDAANVSFTNTTFSTANAGIRIAPRFLLAGLINLTLGKVSPQGQGAYINATNLSMLNTSARLTFTNHPYLAPKAVYDPDDSGVFIDCPPSICTDVINGPSTYVYDVTHFTNFSIGETFAPPAPEFGSWALILALGLVAGGIVGMRGRRSNR